MNRLLILTCLALASVSTAEADVKSEGQLTPPKPFTLMVIAADRTMASQSQVGAAIQQWVTRPQTAQMSNWLRMAKVKGYIASDPFMREHHQYVLSQAESLPAIALVDEKGGCWVVLSGRSLPRSEIDLARALDTYYAATMQAARQSNPGGGYQTMTPAQLEASKFGIFSSAPVNGSDPWTGEPTFPNLFPNRNQRPGGGGGFLNPQVDLNSSVDQETRRDILFLVLLVCGTLMACFFMYSRAITDNDPPTTD